MVHMVNCECGWTMKRSDEDELIDEVEKHAREEHGMTDMTREEILEMAEKQ